MLSNSQQVKWSSSGEENHQWQGSYYYSSPKTGRKCTKVSSWFMDAFRALVTPCVPHCEPVQCGKEEKESYGRRKRREEDKQGRGGGGGERGGLYRMKRDTSGDDLLLANAIHILDKLQFLPGEKEENQVGEEEGVDDEGCSRSKAFLPVSLVAAVFLLLQAIISFMP